MKNRYGQLPKLIDEIVCNPTQMMFYQDMLIKDKRFTDVQYEERLNCFDAVVNYAVSDFVDTYGMEEYMNTYVYLSAKYLFQTPKEPFNRPGWHCDGFMSNDINYIWSDACPTVFNFSQFKLTQDDSLSIKEMQEQAEGQNDIIYPNNSLIRLDQFNVHKVGEVTEAGMRAFVKVSFSKDRFDLIGNAINPLIDYDWKMKPRSIQRNIPQSEISKK